MALPQYSTGTVSVAAGGTTVTGAGVMWSGINVKQGDFISIAGLAEVLITEVTDAANLKIAPWQGPAQSNAPYLIYQNYVGRVVGVAAAEDVGEMLEKLHVDGLPFIVGADETVPDPSYGDEGQLAFKPSTGQWWEKTGGVWVPSSGLTALGYGGTSATSLLIGTGTKAFTTQGGLAYDGARVRAASAANPNNWMEGVADYFDITLTMTSDKIGGSGTHADWLFSIAGQPGVDGLGAGDVIGPASAVIDNIATFAATTGKLIKDGSVKVSDLVRHDIAQTLTEAQDAQARSNIYAAPFDALAYNGMQINGSMEVSQELGATGAAAPMVSAQVKYPVDGWAAYYSSPTAVVYTSQTTPSGVLGFPSAIYYRATTGAAFSGAGDVAILYSRMEGYRTARLGWGEAGAAPITVAFWVNPTVAGTFAVAAINSANNRSYVVDVVLAVGWQYKTVTIPGDVAGVWEKTNLTGILLVFCFASGATARGAANTWQNGYFHASAATTNFLAANNNQIVVTGVTVLPGLEAPSIERAPLIMRPYGQELVTCQRYWQTFPNILINTSAVGTTVIYPVSMRSAPAVSGGGAGFALIYPSTTMFTATQTTQAYQTLIANARL
jgi:hypothetical protein